jgi:hypothetical protein
MKEDVTWEISVNSAKSYLYGVARGSTAIM